AHRGPRFGDDRGRAARPRRDPRPPPHSSLPRRTRVRPRVPGPPSGRRRSLRRERRVPHLRLGRADLLAAAAAPRGRGRGAWRFRVRGSPAPGRPVTRRVSLAFLLALLARAASAEPAPARVASLNLTSDEILVDLLPPERLVAVTRWADDPGT